MLELRPSCEHCNKPLPPDSTEARICSYECTFCAACVDNLLHDVCPNCGGGFVPRPVRPATEWKRGAGLVCDPPTTVVKYRPVDLEQHEHFAARIRELAPERR